MKFFDCKKAKEIIEKHKDNLKEANMGMHEDWWWTATPVWQDGEYLHILPENMEERYNLAQEDRRNGMSMISEEYREKHERYEIAGIYGSSWATPTLELKFKDESTRMIEVSIGENTESGVGRISWSTIKTSKIAFRH